MLVPKTQISGTGRWYNYVSDVDILFTSHRHYRHIIVANNSVDSSNRLMFYALNLEHTMSETNMEIADGKTRGYLWPESGRLQHDPLGPGHEDIVLKGLGGKCQLFSTFSIENAERTENCR